MTRPDHTFWGPLIAVLVPLIAVAASAIYLHSRAPRAFSNTPLSDQISYCYVSRSYTVKHGKHRGERWAKDGYLPCYFIPFRERV